MQDIRQASKDDIRDLLIYAECTRHPVRNQIIVLLSAKAGLRAGKIAKFTWDMILDPNGGMSHTPIDYSYARAQSNKKTPPGFPDGAEFAETS